LIYRYTLLCSMGLLIYFSVLLSRGVGMMQFALFHYRMLYMLFFV
jgi:hypothetical protein